MNKNVKRIVAIALAIGTVSAVAPATNVNLLTTKAYASDTNEEDKLTDLTLETSTGSNIKLYSDNDYASDNKVDSGDVEPDENYYAKTSSDTINFAIDGPSSKYVRVFTSTSDSAKGKKISSDFSLSGSTTFTIKVYGEDPGTSVTNDEDDDYDLLNTYKVKVKYTGSDSSTDSSSSSSSSSSDMTADDYDSIYLDKLSVDGKSITLSESKINYTYNVGSDVDQVTIKAMPEDTDTETVEIDGDEVDDSDNYKNDVSLNKGENKIEIDLTNDDDEERVYTLTINRGSTTSTGTGTTTNTTTSTPSTATDVTTTTVKSQWVKTNGVWQYNDATGKTVKNSWVQNYYLDAYGNMTTGWLNNNGSWYYLGSDGAKKTGWQSVGGTWYYLDTAEGRMQTGWMKDITGKYYYLNSNGSMAYNTTIGGYKLDATGAWTGR